MSTPDRSKVNAAVQSLCEALEIDYSRTMSITVTAEGRELEVTHTFKPEGSLDPKTRIFVVRRADVHEPV